MTPPTAETDAEDPERGVLHHHGRGPRHTGGPPQQLRDPDHAAEAGHLPAPPPRRGLRVHALQRQEQEGQPPTLPVNPKTALNCDTLKAAKHRGNCWPSETLDEIGNKQQMLMIETISLIYLYTVNKSIDLECIGKR